jgi:hypothetical protein
MKNKEEVWKIIPDFEDYQVSNFGNVLSLKRNIPKILKKNNKTNGYISVSLSKKGFIKQFNIHILVATCFLNHKSGSYERVVNHIDNNKKNNNIDNLEIISQRQNTSFKKKSSSKYIGVYWHIRDCVWGSQIHINKQKKHLGYFKTEIEASNAYQKALQEIKNNSNK